MMQKDRKQKAKELVDHMTLEEKVSLCSGKDCWTLKPIKRLGLESIVMMDGPHGLRKQIGEGDNLGIGDSLPSVCFPTASATACSFDRELLYKIGVAMGEECLQEGVSVILGPGVNQKRSPLCGRNFEYFSEDAVVSGELAVSLIKGVQSTGVGTSLKHFAVNNQEKKRQSVNAVVDERTLRETYLKAFEIAVKKGKPDTVMCSYNKLNGEYCSEHKYLLTDILRKEWGFEGAVISDWGAVHDRALGVYAGLDLEMPGNDGYNDAKVMDAIQNGTLAIEALNMTAYRVTELILKGMEYKNKNYRYDVERHHNLAVKAAAESAVLLKNEDNILPGNPNQKVAVIGNFAKQPRYQGAGSSRLHPIRIDNAWDELVAMGLDVTFAKGYHEESKKNQDKDYDKKTEEMEQLIKEACEIAKGKDLVYLFVGLTEGYESEGFDRSTLSIPMEHNRLVEAVCDCNPNVVVVLAGGAPMHLPWLDRVKAVLLAYLSGEGGGKAIARLLLGSYVPCGKLAETWPLKLEDVPSHAYFGGDKASAEYRESIYIGYRYYETAKIPVLFPFGHGLSYTQFHYSDITIDHPTCEYKNKITLTFLLTNTGAYEAKETTFLFVLHKSDVIFLPQKELVEFVNTTLKPGETKEIAITIDTHSFGYYNTKIKDWYAESGEYILMVGGSLKQCELQVSLQLMSPPKEQPMLRDLTPTYFQLKQEPFRIKQEEFEALYGDKLPESNALAVRPFTKENTLEDIQHTWVGKIVIWYAKKIIKEVTKDAVGQEEMMQAMMMEMPFFAMVASGEGMLSESMMEGILDLLNGHYKKGITKLLKH